MANATILLSKESNEYKQLENRATARYGNTVNAIGNREITRYYELLRLGRRSVRRLFTENELQLLADISNGTSFEPVEIILSNNGFLMQFEDALIDAGEYEDYCGKWSVDAIEMQTKLKGLGFAEIMALIDVIEIFWSDTKKYSTLLECLKDLK